MTKALEKTALRLAMMAVVVNGHVFAQGVEGPTVVESFQEAVAPAQPVFSVEQIDHMVAPIALYPDALLAQVLMAATYPVEVVQADQWLKKNRELEGTALDEALAAQPWDPSVKTLVFFPTVLERMAQDLTWTQDLGDAFLAQEADVMGAVQRLRRQAQDAGSLASNSQQIVRTQGSTIVVEPADPTVVYVPSYNPATVYGPAWVPAPTYYPATYTYPSAYPTWVTFGAGALAGALLVAAINWADDDDYYVVHHHHYPRPRHHRHIYRYGPDYWDRDWNGPRYGHSGWRGYRPAYLDRRDVYIDKSKTVNVENNYFKREWEHNPAHRRNVTYRDPNVAKRFVEAESARRVDRDGAKWFGREGAKPLDRDGVQAIDRDALRRLDRREPAMLPSDKATRDALQGDERERRARIMSGERDIKQFGAGARSPEEAAQWQRKGGDLERKRIEGGTADLPQATTRELDRSGIGTQVKPSGQVPQLERPEGAGVQATPRTRDLDRETKARGTTEGSPPPQPAQGWGSRRSPESGAQRVDPSQLQGYPRVEPQVPKRSESLQNQQRPEARQLQKRVEPQIQRPVEPQIQKRSEPWQMQQRPETRQFQQRPDPRQFQQRIEPRPAPQVVAPQQVPRRAEPRQLQRSEVRQAPPPTVQRSAPKSYEPPRQQSGGQSSQQNVRKRKDDENNTNPFGR